MARKPNSYKRQGNGAATRKIEAAEKLSKDLYWKAVEAAAAQAKADGMENRNLESYAEMVLPANSSIETIAGVLSATRSLEHSLSIHQDPAVRYTQTIVEPTQGPGEIGTPLEFLHWTAFSAALFDIVSVFERGMPDLD